MGFGCVSFPSPPHFEMESQVVSNMLKIAGIWSRGHLHMYIYINGGEAPLQSTTKLGFGRDLGSTHSN